MFAARLLCLSEHVTQQWLGNIYILSDHHRHHCHHYARASLCIIHNHNCDRFNGKKTDFCSWRIKNKDGAYAFKAIATRQHFSLILFVSRCGEVSEEETDDGDDETLNNKHCQWDFWWLFVHAITNNDNLYHYTQKHSLILLLPIQWTWFVLLTPNWK